MKLDKFDNRNFDRGKPKGVEVFWIVLQGLLFSSWIPGSGWRCGLLRLFGAKIGKGVVIKAGVRVKFPWRLSIGDFSWIGESVWLDNLAEIRIGKNVCISQGAYLCTGNHDYTKETFDLITKPIVIEEGSWICAFTKIAPGVTVRKNSIVGFGSVLISDTEENSFYLGNPTQLREKRS